MTLRLPAEVWREVLYYVTPHEYTALSRSASRAGVSREFYWLLKNSQTTFRVHRPVVPLCGLVWLHSRDVCFSRIKRVEGECMSHFNFPPPETSPEESFTPILSSRSLLAVAFPARGADLEAIFQLSGCSKSHPIRIIILPNSKQYTGDKLSSDLTALGVEGFCVQVHPS